MSTAREHRDVGLLVHRWLQWIATLSSALLVAFILSGMDTWDRLKEQSIRMEEVPEKVDKILEKVNEIDKTVDVHTEQINELKKQRP